MQIPHGGKCLIDAAIWLRSAQTKNKKRRKVRIKWCTCLGFFFVVFVFFKQKIRSNFFASVQPSVITEGVKKRIKLTAMAKSHKQKRHANQLSNISCDKLFAKTTTEQDQILCLMAWIPAHARVAGWYSEGGMWAWLPALLSPGESQQWAVNKLLWPGWPAAFPSPETCLTLPHRPGSRWPLAAGLACNSVHYTDAMENVTSAKIDLLFQRILSML